MEVDEKALEVLRTLWAETINNFESKPDPDIDLLIYSNSVSIRFATITQILGKLIDSNRDILCLQKGSKEDTQQSSRWDSRSFCSKVVVPWVQETESMRHVIGNSTDPYVSKPLRRPWLHEGLEHVKSRGEWEKLIILLREIQEDDNPSEAAKSVLRKCLESVARRLMTIEISYPVPIRASHEQTGTALTEFIEVSHGGEGLLIATTAVVKVLAEEFGLYSDVKRQGITDSDTASGVPGDILCYQLDAEGEDKLCLVIEAKNRDLTITELDATIHKAREKRLTEMIFVTPSMKKSDAEAIKKRISHEWFQGINVYQISFDELAKPLLMLLGEQARCRILEMIGDEIDDKSSNIALRKQWSDILLSIGTESDNLSTHTIGV